MTAGNLATRRSDLSAIAYGFMASQALFVALEFGIFTLLADGALTPAQVGARSELPCGRVRTLLRALAALGLVVPQGDAFANSPASDRYLVRGRPDDFGDYFRLQVGRQIYPALAHLAAGIGGTGGAFDTISGLLADPQEARTFTRAQHAGSLAAARVLADRVLADRIPDAASAQAVPGGGGAPRLLDVGGGSGAFSIAFCRRFPTWRATVLDLPSVLEVARDYRDEAALTDRVDLLGGDAVDTRWPSGQQVVLMSYLLSALGDTRPGSEVDTVLQKAKASLEPGGLLVVHDFMLDDVGPGPTAAALWFLQYLAYQPDATSFSAADLGVRLRDNGFVPELVTTLIPGITRVVVARKDGAA